MTLQLFIDDQIVQGARKVAASMGTSIDQLIQDYLERLTTSEAIEADLEELDRLSEEAKGDSRGWKFNRDEIYDL